MKAKDLTILVFLFCSTSFGLNFEFTSDPISFQYPVTWEIKSSTESSVDFSIKDPDSIRRASIEILPDELPADYFLTRWFQLKKSFLNVRLSSAGYDTIAGHIGMWFVYSFADTSKFMTYSYLTTLFRIPSLKKVVAIDYSTVNTLYWGFDVQTLDVLFSTVQIEGDTIIDRNNFSNEFISEDSLIKIVYPDNFALDTLAGGYLLEDNFDRIFNVVFRAEIFDSVITDKETYLDKQLDTLIYLDTSYSGGDSFQYLFDTLIADTGFLAYCHGNEPYKNLRYVTYVFTDSVVFKRSFNGMALASEYYNDYLSQVLKNMIFLPDNLKISVFNRIFSAYSINISPNPVNSSTLISINAPLHKESRKPVKVFIYDLAGKIVNSWVLDPGQQHIRWNGSDHAGKKVSTGSYLLKTKIGDKILSKKIVILR